MNELSHLLEVALHQTPGGQSWRAEPQATRSQGALVACTNTQNDKDINKNAASEREFGRACLEENRTNS